jgi:flavorubredoxin
MKTVIVCESMFGNTELLAQAVRTGLTQAGSEVRVVEVGQAVPGDFRDCDLLVVAAPTHALSLSRPETRADAVSKGADPRRAQIGVREWLAAIDDIFPPAAHRPPVAVFDTRVLKARHWSGSAAIRAGRRLRKAGFHVVDRVSFYVDGVTGPLSPGELSRALAWGLGLPSACRRSSGRGPGAATETGSLVMFPGAGSRGGSRKDRVRAGRRC